MRTSSLVIPVKNAEIYITKLLKAVMAQKPYPPDEIILVDSMSTDRTVALASAYDRVSIIPIENFSHGRARNWGAQAATGEILVLMTQDACPADEHWLKELVDVFDDDSVAGVYSRQMPRPDVNPMERFNLESHFPAGELVCRRWSKEGGEMFLNDVFFSNVSAAIRRDVLLEHPFDEELLMSEDLQFARDVMAEGYAIAYQPNSAVIHSHNYPLMICFKRYFDSMYCVENLFPEHGAEKNVSSGAPYLLKEFKYMALKYPLWLPYYACYTAAKMSGILCAHFSKYLPRSILKRMSLHAYYWDKH